MVRKFNINSISSLLSLRLNCPCPDVPSLNCPFGRASQTNALSEERDTRGSYYCLSSLHSVWSSFPHCLHGIPSPLLLRVRAKHSCKHHLTLQNPKNDDPGLQEAEFPILTNKDCLHFSTWTQYTQLKIPHSAIKLQPRHMQVQCKDQHLLHQPHSAPKFAPTLTSPVNSFIT